MHYAHSLPGRPIEEWESLSDHLHRVARLAERFTEKWDAADWGRLAGLWHDVGKYRQEFQARLRDATIHAPHAGVGAALVGMRDLAAGLPLAFVIAGHHAGLANLRDSTTRPNSQKCPIPPKKFLKRRVWTE